MTILSSYPVGAIQQLLADYRSVLSQELFQVPDGHPVGARTTTVRHHSSKYG